MDHSFYSRLLARLERDLVLLPDKPEESAETTLAALWWLAAGKPFSAGKAAQLPLEDLDGRQQERLVRLVDQRLSGIPLAHITGRQQFMGVELLTTNQALIPRKETEILGRAALRLLGDIERTIERPRIMDICTGAGNLAVIMALHSPAGRIYASDLSEDAVSLAEKNAALHEVADRVEVRAGDLFAAFDEQKFWGSMDLVTCNPPYISSARVEGMVEEISGHEPTLAFDGGAFGIKILHRLIKEAPSFMKNNGWLAFEVGLGQGEAMIKRMKKNNMYAEVTPLVDEGGEIRGIIAGNGGVK